MSSHISDSEINALFGEALTSSGANLEKVAEVSGLYIQEKLRENAFSRRILPPQTVTVSELTRSVEDESLRYIDDLEPDSLVMRVNMRGEPDKTYIQGARYAITMETISSDKFQKSEQELRSYRMPLTKVIEQNTVKDIQEINDQKFMEHVRAGLLFATFAQHDEMRSRGLIASTKDNIQSPGELASYLFVGDTTSVTGVGGTYVDVGVGNYTPATPQLSNIIMSDEEIFTRRVITLGMKIMAHRQLKAKVFLLHEADWADIGSWLEEEAGLSLLSEIVVGGYKYTTVLGMTFVTTLRDNPDILEPGQIYMFPAPEFLGRFLILQNLQFHINKDGRFFSMEAWEECGVGFGNVRGLGLILLKDKGINLPGNLWRDGAGTLTPSAPWRLVNDPAAPVQ